MIHRYLATSVGALILSLTVMAWLAWRSQPTGQTKEALSPWWPTFTLFWVCLQGAFGALTVTMKLFPAIVTLHLLGGLTLLVLLGAQAIRQAQVAQSLSPVAISNGLRRLLVLTTLMLVVQLALGGWVSTNYAVLACSEFPTCQGQWWPPMDFEQGFELWRGLGLRADGTPISFAALTAIHYAHRLMALLVLALLGLLAWRLNPLAPLRRQARGLAALAVLQLLTGLSNVVLGWPLLAALLHTGGAAALALVLTWVLLATRGRFSHWPSRDPAAFGNRA
jgi:cytochrome c oxidase assembly protein subunit 15